MNAPALPPALRNIFDEVHEDGDRVLTLTTAAIPEDGQKSGYDAVVCLDVFAHRPTHAVNPFVVRLGELVRPGGLLFLTALSVDHAAWQNPEPGWEPSGSRTMHHRATGKDRFFLYDDEIITIFAAWNVLHHQEGEDGVVDAVFLKPEGRLVDVSKALYEG